MKNSIVASFLSVLVISAFFMSGCDLAKPKNQKQQRQPVAVEAQLPVEAQPEQNEPEQNEDNTVTVKAEVGVGVKGSSYAKPTGGPMDIITVPISAGFRAKERISFQYIDHAMNLFKAEHERVPASHEEFVMEILQKNGIILPQLPSGHVYRYDPSDGELKVQRPRNQQ